MKTLLEIVKLAEDYLKGKGIVRPKREAEELVADVLGLKRIDLFLQFERPLVEEELTKCREALKRRGNGEPLQYIAGQVDFAGVLLKVTPDVLIPRPETEILVEMIASTLKRMNLTEKVLWDMCTGSGAIGIALKKRFPELEVYLSDLSPKALAIAKENALQNGVSVHILEGDLFVPFIGMKCDFFVSNPPYVTEKEYPQLAREVKEHEPKMALVGGEDGLLFYQKIAARLPEHMKSMGWLEIGAKQGAEVLALVSPHYPNSRVEKDWSGHDRFVTIS